MLEILSDSWFVRWTTNKSASCMKLKRRQHLSVLLSRCQLPMHFQINLPEKDLRLSNGATSGTKNPLWDIQGSLCGEIIGPNNRNSYKNSIMNHSKIRSKYTIYLFRLISKWMHRKCFFSSCYKLWWGELESSERQFESNFAEFLTRKIRNATSISFKFPKSKSDNALILVQHPALGAKFRPTTPIFEGGVGPPART